MPVLPPPDDSTRFLSSAGEMGRLVAGHDRSATSLGGIESWPVSLRTAAAMVLHAPVPMTLLWGDDGLMLYNDGYAAISGSRHPGLLGAKVREAWPESASFNDTVMRTVLAGGRLVYHDQPLSIVRNEQDELAWFSLDYSPVLDESQNPAGVLAMLLETTSTALDEARVAREAQRLDELFGQAPGFMATLSGPSHTVEFVNPAFLQLVGHRDVIGMPARAAGLEMAGIEDHRPFDRVYRGGESITAATRKVMLQKTPGAIAEPRFVDWAFQPLRDTAGRVTGVLMQGVDATERVRSEKASRDSEARNRQILDSAIDYAIIAIDLDARVTRWNRGAERILGWSEAEMLGQDAARIFTEEDRAAHRMETEMRQALSTGVGNDERWHVRQSGERFWANGEMTPIRDEAGEATGFVKVLRDRTEQHEAHRRLREIESRLRRAQRAGGIGVFSCDIDSSVLEVTAEFCAVFGIPERPTIDAAELEALIEPEDLGLASNVETRRAESASLHVEYRIRRGGDGELRWISRSAEFEHDTNGRPVRMVGVVQDVTVRKTAQRAADDSAEQFRVFAQAQPNHVWTAPPSGELDWFNDRVYEYSGAAPGKLDGVAWTGIVHPDDLVAAAESWASALAVGQRYEVEFRIRNAAGEYRWHLARALPLRDSSGEITRWVGTNTDIHERKLSEVESKRDRNRMWALSQELMLIADLKGTIVTVNPTAVRVLGWSETEMAGQPLRDFVHPDDVATTAAEVARLGSGGTTLAFENRWRCRDGEYRSFDWTAVTDGEQIHAVGRDVTGQRAAEEALRQAQKMEAVGQLTGGIAHDFNNLLQGISGSLELARKRMVQDRAVDADRFIERALASANRAASLTHRLLAFSRRQPLDPRPLDANALVASMEELVRRTLGEQVRVSTALADDLWLTKCDHNQLENAILNLVINARDAMPRGGQLMVETANVTLDEAAARQQKAVPGRYVCIAVADTGMGMSPATVARVFEPFFTTKPIGQGTGLGLSMIYGFVRQSEGFVKVYSEPGRGSTFKVYLPRHRGTGEAEEALPGITAAHAARAQETILVVEDEPDVRALVIEELVELGYETFEAVDGPSALAILRTDQRIDLLVTDIGLPGMKGNELVAHARLMRPALKVLFMTGYARNAAVAAGFLEPGMHLLTKPFTLEALASRVRDLLKRSG